MAKLAINGGEKYRSKTFPKHPIIGEEEKKAALDVLDRGELSTFLASPGQYFLGGKKIKEFEGLAREYFGVKHAVAMNSATACLHAAIPAVGVQPLDEVLVTPYSMSCSATCALMANTIPVFVDVDENNFAIDPKKMEEKITHKTRAIVMVHLFGGTGDMDGIPVVLMEAMAMGKTVISTTLSGIPELIQSGVNGYLVKPNDASAVAEIIQKRVRKLDPKIIRKKIENEFYSRNNVSKLIEIWKKLK